MKQVTLTKPQTARLEVLEKENDGEIHVVGHFSGCPVLRHYGLEGHKRRRTEAQLAYLSRGGRLRYLGPMQRDEATLGAGAE